MQAKEFSLRSLTIGGTIQSNATVSLANPALKLTVSESLRILPGGKVLASWVEINSKSLTVDGSGEIFANGGGLKNGKGVGLGMICSLNSF